MSTTASAIVWVHGGPGLHSFAEMGRLAPLLEERGIPVLGWNEPSRFRNPGHSHYDFENWLASLREFIAHAARKHPHLHVLGHSFGAIGAVKIAAESPERFARLSLIAPALDQFETQKNIVRIALSDFRKTDPNIAARMETLLAASKSAFDSSLKQALELAAQDPLLLTHYWAHPSEMQASLAYFAAPEQQVDMDAFFGVLGDFSLHHELPALIPPQVPVHVLFGESDPVIHQAAERKILQRLAPHAQIEVQAGASHFIPLDLPARAADWLLREE